MDFIARLAALVPQPRVNLTRYHGVFAPNSRLRSRVTPARRNRRDNAQADTPRHAAMTWAQRLKRVFSIDIETCERCGGPVKVIASIEHPQIIKQILDHVAHQEQSALPHSARGPPPAPAAE